MHYTVNVIIWILRIFCLFRGEHCSFHFFLSANRLNRIDNFALTFKFFSDFFISFLSSVCWLHWNSCNDRFAYQYSFDMKLRAYKNYWSASLNILFFKTLLYGGILVYFFCIHSQRNVDGNTFKLIAGIWLKRNKKKWKTNKEEYYNNKKLNRKPW